MPILTLSKCQKIKFEKVEMISLTRQSILGSSSMMTIWISDCWLTDYDWVQHKLMDIVTPWAIQFNFPLKAPFWFSSSVFKPPFESFELYFKLFGSDRSSRNADVRSFVSNLSRAVNLHHSGSNLQAISQE